MMNRYRITYIGLDEGKRLSRVIYATSQAEALQLFSIPFNACKVIPSFESVKQFSSEPVEKIYERYTKNLRQLDYGNYEYGSFVASVEEYWEREEWEKLSILLEGALPFCKYPRVKRDIRALQLFSNKRVGN
jgi:hypothetical protein